MTNFTNYDIYILILSLAIFVMFTAVFSILLGHMVKSSLKLIRYGDEDKTILKNRKYLEKGPSKMSKFERVFSAFLSVVLIVVFILALCISCTNNEFDIGLSGIKVVKSDSMATKNEKNTYIFENNLSDQFDMFDVVMTHPLPAEDELKLYDIVVYERDGMLVIHRIVEIEEPNEKHSERYFKTQGDAISRHDIYPVLYSQMKAIYRGEHIPFVGSIITFIQAPPGWVCFFLILVVILIMPVIESKLLEEMRKRLALLDAKESVPAVAEPAIEEISEPVVSPEPTPEPTPTPAPLPSIKSAPTPVPSPAPIPNYPTYPKPRLVEERLIVGVPLERRKPIAPAYNVKPLDLTPPKYPGAAKIGGEPAKNSGRMILVPILLDGKKDAKKVVMKPISRFVKFETSDDGSKINIG